MSNAMKGADPVSELSRLRLYLLRVDPTFTRPSSVMRGQATVAWPARLFAPGGRFASTHLRGLLGLAVGLAAIVAMGGALSRPSPPSLSTTVTGDADLAARARPLLSGALDRVSIAVLDGTTVTYANFGAKQDTEYEIGSITKTFTGLLLADAIERGEVTADTRLGALLPLAGAPVADVTLAELASHRAGLSAQGMQLDETIPFLVRLQMHRNPFEQDRDGVLAIARKATLTTRGEFVYSNLGTALLGHALASMAHRDYVTLVQQRLLIPLGMSATTLPLTAKDLRTDAPTGYSADGAGEAPWTVNGWGPAGGARSTPADMARFARALLDGSAPGMDALMPQWDIIQGAQQIGYAWQTQRYKGHLVTFKTGLTGGFTSKIALDRDSDRAVIVLSNTVAQVDDATNRLLVPDLP
jgi:CubicO group peptidase (beta-lactamase class C family)